MGHRRHIWFGVAAFLLALVGVVQPATPAAAANEPTITTQPPADTYAVLGGGTVSVTSAGTGSPTPTIQWETSTNGGATWSNVPGKTSATLTGVSLTDLSQVGTLFRAAYTNANGTTRTNATTLRRGFAPVVTQDPTPTAAFVPGSSLTMAVAATGTPTPTVQWKACLSCAFGGPSNVTGGTSTSLTVSPTSTKVYYQAVFTNSVGTATTQNLYVSSSGIGITFSPPVASQTVFDGQVTTFTATANAYPAPTYQWQRYAVGSNTPVDIPGETGATLSFVAHEADSGTRYRVVATNPSTTSQSAPATLTVDPPVPTAPTVVTHPASKLVPSPGSVATFTASAGGYPAPTVAWERSTDNGGSWAPMAGESSTTLSVTTQASDAGNRYRAVFTNATGSATTNAATLTIGTAPTTVTVTPTSSTVADGDTASFASTADGYPAPTIQWQRSLDNGTTWANLAGETGAALSFTVADADHGARYRAVATNAQGSATSAAATLTGVAPTFTKELPANQNVTLGVANTFTVAASGSPAPTIQWQRRNTDGSYSDIAGATGPTYTFTGSLGSPRLRAVATNRVGSATTSTQAVFSRYPLQVSSSPQSKTVTSGENVTFTASFVTYDNNDNGLSVTPRWERSTDGGSTWAPVGTVSTTLTIPATLAMSGDKFRAVGESDFGNATSSIATLTVTGGPKITTSPANVGLASPKTVMFTSAAIGEPNPTVQWQRSAGSPNGPWTDMGGATSPTLSFFATNADDGTLYRAVWTNSAGSVATAAATLRFGLPVFTSAPSGIIYYGPGNVPVTVSAAATGSPAPTFTWYSIRDGGRLERGTGPSVTLGIPFEPTGTYYVDATNAAGTVTQSFKLVEAVAAEVTTPPSSITVADGMFVTFTSAGVGTPAPTMQWERSDDGCTTWNDVPGATLDHLTMVAEAEDSGARFRVRYVNPFATSVSAPATLTVTDAPTPPVVIDQPDDVSTYAGDTVSFTAAAQDHPALLVHWQYRHAGAGSWTDLSFAGPTLTFDAQSSDHLAQVRARFDSPAGPSYSDPATITILTPAPATIAVGPGDAVGHTGTPVSFTVTPAGSPTPTVQWQRKAGADPTLAQWTNIPGATSATYTFTPTTSNYFDQYRAVVTNRFGSATSTPAALRLTDAPVITMSPLSKTVTSGQTASFIAFVEEEWRPSVTYRWERSTDGGGSWSTIAGATTKELSVPGVTLADDGNRYRIVATNPYGSTESGSATLTVSGTPVVTTQPQSVTVAIGDTATLGAAVIGEPVPTVQWQRSSDGSSAWTDVAGATGNPYSWTAALADTGFYRARFTNASGSVTTNVVKVDVGLPAFTSAPDVITYAPGHPVTVSATAQGAPAPTITWWGEWLDTNHFCDEEQMERCPIVRYDIIGTGSTVTLNPPYTSRDTYYVAAQNSLGTTKHQVTFAEQPAPTISGSRSAVPNGAGWYKDPVTVSFTCESTVLAACTPPVSVAGDGAGQSVTGTAVDVFGQTATTEASGINVDTTPPTISGAATTPANPAGGYFGAVTVHWTCGDATSGVSLCPADQTVSGEGNHTVTGVAIDRAGNTTNAEVTIRIDHDTSQDPGIIHGRVTDRVSGAPVAGATVMLYVPTTMVKAYSTTTATDGTYLLPAIADGTYVLTITKWGTHLQTWYPNVADMAASTRLAVTKGSNRTIDQTLAPGYVLSGRLTSSATGDPVSGATIRVQGGGVEYAAVSDPTGRRHRLTLPPPGHVALFARALHAAQAREVRRRTGAAA
ncbi:MAG: carboxypeptidase regulatory-like domain-containing protein, partial [Aquihabitans sp.]